MSVNTRHTSIDAAPPVVYCMSQEIGASINGQWLPISHPGDSSGRGTGGDTVQGRRHVSIGEPQVCDSERILGRSNILVTTKDGSI